MTTLRLRLARLHQPLAPVDLACSLELHLVVAHLGFGITPRPEVIAKRSGATDGTPLLSTKAVFTDDKETPHQLVQVSRVG